MESKTNNQELLSRMKELEEENKRLRNVYKLKPGNELTVIEGEYKGHPVLTFGGSCRPFSIGLRKLQVLKQAWPQIEIFLQKHDKPNSSSHIDNDEIKI